MSGYKIPSRTVVAMVIRTDVMRFLFICALYTRPIPVVNMSISLMPMNGAISPPTP